MSLLDLSRWQFGMTIVYHFLFVPLNIGLAPLLAIMQTVAVRTGSQYWMRMVKFFSKIFLINFAIGVATGIVQEFQIGLNWAGYSRFVGDVFGAPLALEGIIAFFMESTFIGLWIFGWEKLPPKIHTLCIWCVAIGVNLSAYFIIVANSFMQHPVGATLDTHHHKLVLHSIWQLLTNNTAIVAFAHTLAGSWLTASTFVAGIAGFWMVRDYYKHHRSEQAARYWRPVFRMGLWVIVFSGIFLAITGDLQGKLMFEQQPMKMASAESLCSQETGASFSILSVGTHNNCESVKKIIFIPKLTSFLATDTFNSTLMGIEDMQNKFSHQFGPGEYRPNLFVTYWSFRFMIGWAGGSAFLALVGLWLTRNKRVITQRWFAVLAILAVPTPLLANSCGWVFTEMGRGPWTVAPNPAGDPNIHMRLSESVSHLSVPMVVTSLSLFILTYTVIGFMWLFLVTRYVLHGLPATEATSHHKRELTDSHVQLDFAY